jgi:hypothetical protein
MRCEFCGADNEKNGLFCSKCGKSFSKTKGSIGEEEPLMVLKPKFILGANKGFQIGITLFITIFFTGIFGFLFNIPFMIAAAPSELGISPYPFIIIGLLCLVCFPTFSNLKRKKSLERTEYRIFDDRIEYQGGFYNFKRRSVFFENIAEVYMFEAMFQRKHNLGTIHLVTPALATMKGHSAGIQIQNIEDPLRIYKKLQEMISKIPKKYTGINGGRNEKGLGETGLID